MLRHSACVSLALFACLSQAGCGRPDQSSNPPVKRYELQGQVVRLEPQTRAAVIDGQKIEGWMDAMTMEYPVKNATDYQSLRPGQHIKATVFVQGMEFWIGEIRVITPSGR